MARKSEPKPLFSLKQDFVDSLDRFCHEAIMLHQQVQAALDLGALDAKPQVKQMVRERLDAFRKAMSGDD